MPPIVRLNLQRYCILDYDRPRRPDSLGYRPLTVCAPRRRRPPSAFVRKFSTGRSHRVPLLRLLRCPRPHFPRRHPPTTRIPRNPLSNAPRRARHWVSGGFTAPVPHGTLGVCGCRPLLPGQRRNLRVWRPPALSTLVSAPSRLRREVNPAWLFVPSCLTPWRSRR